MSTDLNYNIKMQTLTPIVGSYALYDSREGDRPTILVEELVGWAMAVATPRRSSEFEFTEEETIVGVVLDDLGEVCTPQSTVNFLGYVTKEQLDRLAPTYNLEYVCNLDMARLQKFKK